jgi:TonB family protein
MIAKKNHLVFGFLIAGIFFLFAAWLITLKTDSFQSQQLLVARVQRDTGGVFIYRTQPFQKIKVEKTENVLAEETIETDDIGEAFVTTLNAYRLRLYTNSSIMIERQHDKQQERYTVYLKRGNLRVENYGPQENLWISRNGQKISAAAYNTSEWVTQPVPSSEPPKKENENLSLSEDEISAVMSSNKNYFFKCYTQLLQTHPQAKGEVTISFTIENNGKISVSEVTSSSLPQAEFHRCLKEVINRIEFKPFQGPPISTLFPIDFK